jgi:hemoglobin/transferrin/lactoferrin receptor protein
MKKIITGVLCVLLYTLSNAQLKEKPIQDTSYFEEVVVSATRDSEKRKNIGQQILTLDKTFIENSQSQTMADVLSSSGEIFVQRSQQGGGSPVIRGFEASRILLAVDGVRMNNLIYRAGHLQNIITVDPYCLERAEVLYGPASVMFGSDALGGVVHMMTKRPEFGLDGGKNVSGSAFTRFSSVNNESTSSATINIGGNRMASLTSVSYSTFGDLRGGTTQNPFAGFMYGERNFYVDRINGKDSLVKNTDRFVQVSSGYRQYNLLQKLSLRSGQHTTHTLNVQFSNSSDVPRYDRLTDISAGALKYAEWYYGPQLRGFAAYEISSNNDARYIQRFQLRAHGQKIQESRYQRKFLSDALQKRIEDVLAGGINIDARRNAGSHEFRFGAEAIYNTLTSTSEEENIVTGEKSPLDTRYPGGDNYTMNGAAYFLHIWKLKDDLTISTGGRAGYSMLHSTITDTTFFKFPFQTIDQKTPVYSGSFSIVHMAADNLKLSWTVSTGYRVPNIDDLAKIFESSPGQLIVPNPNLKPETTVGSEWSVNKTFAKNSYWEFCAYMTEYSNALQTAPYTFGGRDSVVYDNVNSAVFAQQNQGKSIIYGASVKTDAALGERMRVLASIQYTYGRVTSDTVQVPLDHIPPVLARLQLTYQHRKFGSDFYTLFNGAKKIKDYSPSGEDNLNYAPSEGIGMPAWLTLNWRVRYTIAEKLQIAAGLENILDTQYRTFASGINAPGRNFYTSIRYNF